MQNKSFIALFLLLFQCSALGADVRRYINLNNPTEYLFSFSNEKILQIMREVHGPKSWGPLAGSYYEERGVYEFGVFNFYTQRYWSGRLERSEDINPPEAGRIGTIQNNFIAHIIPKGENRTLISITVESFEQQVSRRYRVFPHFQKVPVFVDVKSDTYFEYLFLLKLGEMLGEKNMPLIKGSE